MTPLDQLEKDIDWRVGELAVLKLLLVNKSRNETERAVLFRAGWTLLYAHYEGFCKFALNIYYDAIIKSGICHKDLPQKMQAWALDRSMKQLRNLPTIDLILSIGNFQVDILDKPASFPDVETNSNLWPDTIRELLDVAQIKIQFLDTNNRALGTLVSRRNKIAHGQKDMILEYSYYLQYSDLVEKIMYEITLSIDEKINEFGMRQVA